VVEDLRKGFAQGRDGALQIHGFGGGDDDEGGMRARRTGERGRGIWVGIWFRTRAGEDIPGRWVLLISGPGLTQALIAVSIGPENSPA
jgi:hypothetical protein